MVPKVFISYAHKDIQGWNALKPQFANIKRQYGIEIWDDHAILPGQSWEKEILTALGNADIVVLIVSDTFIDSDFCWSVELSEALERHQAGEAVVVPVWLHPCDTEALPFAAIQRLPNGPKPISSWTKPREARADVAKGLRKVVEHLVASNFEQKVDIFNLPAIGPSLFGRQKEINRLNDAWNDPNTNVISIVADGGIGKSAVAKQWLMGMAPNYGGASHIYGWSFYSQGTDEKAQTTSDAFFDDALKFFDVQVGQGTSIYRKAEILAHAISAKRAILVLDGVEPLQHGNILKGVFKDKAVQTLLQDLIEHNRGICVVTTRVGLTNEMGQVPEINLNALSAEAGAHLLRSLHVKGDADELKEASKENDGHALAVTLLGIYLTETHGGDVSQRHSLENLSLDGQPGQHARRVMNSLIREFGENSVEKAVLSILGLFDRPADDYLVSILRAEPVIRNLTEPLVGLDKANWDKAMTRLQRLRIVFRERGATAMHPLLREHFGKILKKEHPQAWKTANNRLYEKIKGSAKMQPSNLRDMAPLYRAIAHGCEAGRAKEAREDIYWKRILRKHEFYSWFTLGAYSSDLAALSAFFDEPWSSLASKLSEDDQASVLNWSAFCLRALGRLREALGPLQAGMTLVEKRKDWKNAASDGSTLMEVFLSLGEIEQAVIAGKTAVSHANRTDIPFHKMARRAELAHAIHQSGKTDTALEWFNSAESIQIASNPKIPFLYSIVGTNYCDLLIEAGLINDATELATKNHKIMTNESKNILSNALTTLNLAQCISKNPSCDQDVARPLFNDAVDDLRRANDQSRLPYGLVSRAEYRRKFDNSEDAKRDLDESERLCRRSELRLLLADTLLERARLDRDKGNTESARVALTEAAALVEVCGYGRRTGAVAELRGELS